MFEDVRDEFFPAQIADGIIAESYTDLSLFWHHAGKLMDSIFPSYSSLGAYGHLIPEERQPKAHALRNRFAQSHHEYHLFRTAENEYIGYSYGDMRDSQTYFMTSSGVLSVYRQRGIYTGYLKQLLAYLHAIGYERVVSNHHPNNRGVIIAKLKVGFNITAVNLDERWGAQVELTYLFHDDRRHAFNRAFSLEERELPRSHL